MIESHPMVSREQWIEARKQLLATEKDFTRLRDQLSQQRRDLPWERVDPSYVFDGPDGKETLADLFAGRSQLIVYHFMFHPTWDAGCKSCSFWADNFNDIIVHLNHRDVTLVAISRAPLPQLEAFKQRMGWSLKWVSSFESSFNYDYHVSFKPEDLERGDVFYNYANVGFGSPEAPGISVFHKDADGNVSHTYSCYSRGLDMLNGAYHLLDLVPKGRDEAGQGQFWVRHHDNYDT
jgi:predicted dithiol-disulfide oxidoreductase (DUF899 family)